LPASRRVAVHQPERATVWPGEPVRRVEPRARVRKHLDRDAERHRALLPLGRAEQREQRDRGVVLHHQGRRGVVVAQLDHGHHVRVVQLRREPRLALEHPAKLRLARQVGADGLHRDEALEPVAAAQARDEHRAHPASRQLDERLVAPERRRRDRGFEAARRCAHGRRDGRADAPDARAARADNRHVEDTTVCPRRADRARARRALV
jgi:hypothetical protein